MKNYPSLPSLTETSTEMALSAKKKRRVQKGVNIWKNSVRALIKALVPYRLALEDPNTIHTEFLMYLQGFSSNTWKKLVKYARRFAIGRQIETHQIDTLLEEMLEKFLIGDNEGEEEVNQRMTQLLKHSRLLPKRKKTFYEPEGRARHFRALRACLPKYQDDRINNHDDYELKEMNFDFGLELLQAFVSCQSFEDNNLQNDQGEANIERNQLFPGLDH